MTPFLDFAIESGALRFGEFQTKAGRLSPYFFDAGLFNNGVQLQRLARFYIQKLQAENIGYDMFFGPAYKGIPLVCATALTLAADGKAVPFAFNRKEAKLYGEKGQIIGAPVQGRVVIIDDVISSGLSLMQALQIIRAAKAEPVAVIVALNRMEKKQAELETLSGSMPPVFALSDLDQMIHYLKTKNHAHLPRIEAYRACYGQ